MEEMKYDTGTGGREIENSGVFTMKDRELWRICGKASTIVDQNMKRQMESWARHLKCGAGTGDRQLLTNQCERLRIIENSGSLSRSDRESLTT